MKAKEVVRRVNTEASRLSRNFLDPENCHEDCQAIGSFAFAGFLESLDAEIDAEEEKHPDEYTPDDNPRLWRATMEACACGGKPPEDRAMCPACRVWHLWCGRDVVAAAKKTCGNCEYQNTCTLRAFLTGGESMHYKGQEDAWDHFDETDFHCNHHAKGDSDE